MESATYFLQLLVCIFNRLEAKALDIINVTSNGSHKLILIIRTALSSSSTLLFPTMSYDFVSQSAREIKAASHVLQTIWAYKDLRNTLNKAGWTKSHFKVLQYTSWGNVSPKCCGMRIGF